MAAIPEPLLLKPYRSPLHVIGLLGWTVMLLVRAQGTPSTKEREACGVTCLGWCRQHHALKGISLAIAIPPPLLFLFKLGVDWWYFSVGYLALDFCIFRCTARALTIF